MDITEHELVQRFQDGERGSFESLVHRWDDRVLALAYRITGSAEDAEDVRQNAFVRAYCRLAGFDGKAEFSTWLYRVVINLCRDALRSFPGSGIDWSRLRYSGGMVHACVAMASVSHAGQRR